MDFVLPLDTLIPVALLGAAVGVHAWRSKSRWPAILGTVAAALAIPLLVYFVAPGPILDFVLIGGLILLMIHILRHRGWW